MLVRLRLFPGGALYLATPAFQSHAGSIEARMGKDVDRSTVPSFQSHAGSIEALKSWSASRVEFWFQSHAGSIEAGQAGFAPDSERRVSIPRWFD